MTREQRREQLLDAAAAFVVRHDVGVLTMERLAEAAGVSKALPYAHFANIEHALLELYRREATALGAYIWHALEVASAESDLIRVHIAAYFDGLERTGDVIGALTAPGSQIPARLGPRQEGPRFSARLLRRFHGVDRDRADAIGGVVNATVLGAGNTWRRGAADRATCEDLAAHVLRSVLAWDGGR